MKLAMVLYHYFPYGGLQRDFARIARAAVARGHNVFCLTADWQGAPLESVQVITLAAVGHTNHGRMRGFASSLQKHLATHEYDQVLGFNRLPNLDWYFAADSCFAEHLASKPALARWLPRYTRYLKLEQAVVEKDGPVLLFLNDDQCQQYRRHYPLPPERYRVLPPGIEPDRRRPADYAQRRAALRQQWDVTPEDVVLLFLGSGFKVKGLDRALTAFASLDHNARLLIVGNDDAAPYLNSLNEEQRQRVTVLGPRDDVPDLMQAADLLLHPAYRESAGMVLLEATVAGLPVLTTDTCGYARYVREAGSGQVMESPFSQEALNDTLAKMVTQLPGPWQENGLAYAEQPGLYQLPDTVVGWIEEQANG